MAEKRIKWDYDKVKNFIEEESNSGCRLLSNEYKNSRTNISIACKCGTEFKTTFGQFNYENKRQCNNCGVNIRAKKKKLSYAEVKHFVEIESNSECKLLSEEYENSKTKMKLQCGCGNVFETNFSAFKRGSKRQCNECGYENKNKAQTLTYQEIRHFVEIESNSNCKLLSREYIGDKQKLSFKCKCGSKFTTTFNAFKGKNKRQCNTCGHNTLSNKLKISFAEVKQFIETESDSGCILLSKDYKGNKSKLEIQCECGDKFTTTFNKFKSKYKRQCNGCSASKGEIRALKWLNSKNIHNIMHYKFDDCRSINLLPFDFYLPYHNLLVEYDGEQHFMPVDFGGKGEEWALEQHLAVVERDNIKNQYCKDNSIPLLRIPYWDFDNIEEKLEEWLTKQGVSLNENTKQIS